MSAQPVPELKLEIGHVLFIDLVGYSRLLIEEQRERLNQLTEVVLQTPQVREATDEQLVRLPTGDGMALVFRHSAAEPARCALEVAEALKKHPEIPVRMGIHSGPVSEVTDVSGRTNLAGTGINVAQRVMDCGDAGHILLSKRAADDLSPYRQWSVRLHDLGECEVKHGVRLQLFNLHTDEVGNAHIPERLRRTTSADRARSTREIAAPDAAISIAVLPFADMSATRDQDYLCEGMAEEIMNSLVGIEGIRVASRTSAFRARRQGMDLPEIARALSVGHILEGSIRTFGSRLRVAAQLTETERGFQLWSERFDRELKDIFAVQDEIAALGEIDAAFELFARAEDAHQLWLYYTGLPGFDSLRTDPRFTELCLRLELPPA
jgi:adenylate cyclase